MHRLIIGRVGRVIKKKKSQVRGEKKFKEGRLRQIRKWRTLRTRIRGINWQQHLYCKFEQYLFQIVLLRFFEHEHGRKNLKEKSSIFMAIRNSNACVEWKTSKLNYNEEISQSHLIIKSKRC